MVQSRSVKGPGSARTKGARRATGVGADAAAEVGALGPGQRWSAGRKREVVLRLLRGESLDAVSREVGGGRDRSIGGRSGARPDRVGPGRWVQQYEVTTARIPAVRSPRRRRRNYARSGVRCGCCARSARS